jgi:hypothetical protein
MYAKVLGQLSAQAVYGAKARGLITAVVNALANDPQHRRRCQS